MNKGWENQAKDDLKTFLVIVEFKPVQSVLLRIRVFCAPTTREPGAGGVHYRLSSCKLSPAVTRDTEKPVTIRGISCCHQMEHSD